MSKNTNYGVHSEILKTIDYKILVLTLPENEIEDVLTQFVKDRGKISKSLYDDFLIAHCIANLNQFMAHIQAISVTSPGSIDLVALRQEITDLILKYNPLFEPSNIVINSNKVLKLKTDKDTDTIRLDENVYWNKSYYDENGHHVSSNKKNNTSDNPMSKAQPKQPSIDNVKNIHSLEWTPTKVFWERLNIYINIKKFSIEDVDHLLVQRYFHNNISFCTYIVQECIIDVEEIYEQIDGMGVNVDPNKIIRELFQLCVNVNEAISYKRAKDLQQAMNLSTDEDDEPVVSSPTQKMYTSKDYTPKKNKKTKASFKQVPKEDLLKLGHNMKVALVGQDDAVDKLSEAIKRASVGLKDPIKPIGSFLFAGRTGCGKTLASKVLADELIRSKKNRIVIDCSEYSSDHEYAKLIGAPAGYIGHDNGGILTNAIAENPFSVVVFDEIEKASSKVYDLMLQIFDEGRLTDGKGQAVSFKDAVIIMTSNIGVKEVDEVSKTIGFGDVAVVTETKKNKALDSALKKRFKPEFLNRIDAVVHFKDLNEEDYMRIIDIELYKLSEYLKANDTEYKNITLNFDEKVRKYIFDNGVNDQYGARPIRRAIEKLVANEISGVLLENNHSPYAEINVTVEDEKVIISVVDKEKEQEALLLVHGAGA